MSGDSFGKKKTESRRRLARSRIHVALAHTQLVRVIVVVVVRLRLLSQAAQVLLFLDGCQVRSLRRQTKRGLAQYRYRFRNGRRLVFSFGRRRAGRRNYVFFFFFCFARFSWFPFCRPAISFCVPFPATRTFWFDLPFSYLLAVISLYFAVRPVHFTGPSICRHYSIAPRFLCVLFRFFHFPSRLL